MKVLIISDTHGNGRCLQDVLKRVGPIDALIHCGDVEGEEDALALMAQCPAYIVAGNNDYFSNLSRELEFELGGRKILVTHGHNYGVSMSTEYLIEEGLSRGVDIVMFGHTHRPHLDIQKEITVLNPGSLVYPRQYPRKPSFMIMEIDDQGEVHYTAQVLDIDRKTRK